MWVKFVELGIKIDWQVHYYNYIQMWIFLLNINCIWFPMNKLLCFPGICISLRSATKPVILFWMWKVVYVSFHSKGLNDSLRGSRGVMVNTLDSFCNDSGSIPSSGSAKRIWLYHPCSSAMSSARDVKQGCRLCTHAFKIMHGCLRTWMTKRKSRGRETYR